MPIAQRYGQRTVSPTALPGVRMTASETALSEGAGVEQARAQKFGALSELGAKGFQIAGGEYARMQQQERDRADQVALLDAQNQIDTWENQRLYDPNTGALAQKGKDAMGLPESVGSEYQDLTGQIEAGLSTQRQRDAFQAIKQKRGQDLDLTLRRHVFGEIQNYEQQETKATVQNAQSNALTHAEDPTRVASELSRGEDAINGFADRNGLGAEERQAQIDGFRSDVHVGIIDRLLNEDKADKAQAYFDETKDQIKGDALGQVEKALEVGTVRKQAQQQADKILAGGGTLTEQRQKASQIADPQLRDAVTERLEHEAAVADAEQRRTEEQNMLSAFNTVDQTHDVTNIPTGIWTNLSGSAREGLRVYAQRLVEGVPVQTDLPTYYGLMTKAADDPEGFATTNLLDYRAKLGETEFKQLTGLQVSLRSKDTKKADEDLADFRTKTQVLEDTLSQYGIDPNAKPTTDEGKAVAELRRMLDRRVESFSALTQKKPSNSDMQSMLDDLMSQSTTVKGSWWALVNPFSYNLSDTQKRLFEVQPGDIPANERTLIESALRKRGRPVNDQTVLDLWIETKARQKGGGQ